MDRGGGGEEGRPHGEGGGLLREQEAGAQPHSGIVNMGHNQFQNIPHYILWSDPQKLAKLGKKMFKHLSNFLFTQSKFVPC